MTDSQDPQNLEALVQPQNQTVPPPQDDSHKDVMPQTQIPELHQNKPAAEQQKVAEEKQDPPNEQKKAENQQEDAQGEKEQKEEKDDDDNSDELELKYRQKQDDFDELPLVTQQTIQEEEEPESNYQHSQAQWASSINGGLSLTEADSKENQDQNEKESDERKNQEIKSEEERNEKIEEEDDQFGQFDEGGHAEKQMEEEESKFKPEVQKFLKDLPEYSTLISNTNLSEIKS